MPTMSLLRRAAGAAAGVSALATAGAALAWGASGHRLVGEAAMQSLPSDLPAFLRAPATVQAVGELAREPDRSKGAGQPHDHDLDPGHFLDLDDAGRVLGGPALADLPADREAYDAALRKAGTDSYKAGYLPYNIEDGYEQLVKDLAYWRIETAALKSDTNAAERAWIAADLAERQALVIRDLGYWAHFVGDGSQPLHISVHFNGWGEYPNPQNYTRDKIHGPFEGPFVHDHVTLQGVMAAMSAPKPCAAIASCTAAYLAATNAWVVPLYQMWGAGEFASADAKSVAFTTARVADGASALRDMIVSAWQASGEATIGYKPALSVREAEAGQPVPFAALYGDD
jgi:hypothetical protein